MSFLERVGVIFKEQLATFAAKNHDYGNSINLKSIFCPSVSVEDAIKVRLGDKIARLQQLVKNEEAAEVKDESLDETLKDAINYAVAWLIQRRIARFKEK